MKTKTNSVEDLKLISRSRAASYLAISKETLDTLINSGRIGFIQIGTRKKISLGEIKRFLESNTTHFENHSNGSRNYNPEGRLTKDSGTAQSEDILKQLLEGI